ncbi:unnamed protein product [Heterobilharzia americana]|nr:unnamed protein product [Heterobilharzia americana]
MWSKKLINDSDGRQYPFYNINHSLYNINKGLVKKLTLNLYIKDYFHPSVVWKLPFSNDIHLTEINRKQKFFIWLIIIKYDKKYSYKDEITVLKKIRWEYNLYMKIDSYMPLGNRIREIYDIQNNQIIIMNPEKLYKLPIVATFPPHCNALQSLIWYPKDVHKSPRILVPPKQIIVSWDEWVYDMLGSNIRICKPNEVSVIE